MFIVLEGIDGCGKSTHAHLLAKWLEDQGHTVLQTAEPTKSAVGRLTRLVLSGELSVSPRTLALLFTGDRMGHVRREIVPALEQGKTVVCERYWYSTVAYQSAQGLDREWLVSINGFAPEPDVALLLDVAPKEGEARTSTGEIFEKAAFLTAVAGTLHSFPELTVVDSSGTKEQTAATIREHVVSVLSA